jgi:hypothetical protein
MSGGPDDRRSASMQLALGLVVGRLPDGCSVTPLGGSGPLRAGFSEPFRSRAGSLPDGSLVALDTETTTPLVVWRWFPARVLAVTGDQLTLDEPMHGVIDARVNAALGRRPRVGEAVYASIGLTEDWRIDATEDDPAVAAGAFREIEALYRRLG